MYERLMSVQKILKLFIIVLMTPQSYRGNVGTTILQ